MASAALISAAVDYVGSNFDVPGFFTAVRGNAVGQEFQKRLSAIDYRIQRQQLHRDDLRDLMELTTGRMDIYHLVGTLLLTFCVTWFTDNGVLKADLPDWFITMFLINNFSACGYLMLSVWLAMHTSICAHTIGVRLLTSFARLSIPSKEELDNIRVDTFPSLNKFLEYGSGMLEKAGTAVKGMIDGNARAAALDKTAPAQRPANEIPSAGLRSSEKPSLARQLTIVSHDEETAVPKNTSVTDVRRRAVGPNENPQEEAWEDHHFEHYTREQDRWRSFDKYARICMSFGVSQMLDALAFYILGVVWIHTQWAAVLSVCAVKMLGILLMVLDTHSTNGWLDCIALFLFYLLPALLSGVFVRQGHMMPRTLNVAVPACYILKGCWLAYAYYVCMRDGVHVQERLRTVGYLDVLDDEQRQLAKDAGADVVRSKVGKLEVATEQLQAKIKDVMLQEDARSEVIASTRNNPEIRKAYETLKRRLEQVRFTIIGKRPAEVASASEALRKGDTAVKRYEVWVKTPEILDKLEALRELARKGWFSDEQQRSIMRQYRQFLEDCERYHLGVVVPIRDEGCSEEQPALRQSSAGTGYLLRFKAHTVPASDRSLAGVRVAVHHPDTGLPDSVWLDPSGELQDEPPPESHPITSSFNSTVNKDLPRWRGLLPSDPPEDGRPGSMRSFEVGSLADPLLTSSSAGGGTAADTSGRFVEFQSRSTASDQATAVAGGGRASHSPAVIRGLRNPGCEGFSVDSSIASDAATPQPWFPTSAIPSVHLPGQVVRWFTGGTMAWWVLGAAWFSVTVELEDGRLSTVLGDALEPVPLELPAPASFFSFQSLQCQGAGVWLSTRFTMYSASRAAGTGGLALHEMADMGTLELATAFCRPGGGPNASSCDVLTRDAAGSWQLGPLTPAAFGNTGAVRLDQSRAPLPVRMPLPWRLVAATWAAGAGAQGEPQALLAGWDGRSVVVAQLRREGSGWTARPRFEVDPRHGRCAANAHDGGSVRVCGDTGARRALKSLLGVARKPNLIEYRAIRDIEFASQGQVLAVLTDDGDLDLWCLPTSELLGRWALGAEHVRVCHNGEHFLVAHRRDDAECGRDGPGIATLKLTPHGNQGCAVGESLAAIPLSRR